MKKLPLLIAAAATLFSASGFAQSVAPVPVNPVTLPTPAPAVAPVAVAEPKTAKAKAAPLKANVAGHKVVAKKGRATHVTAKKAAPHRKAAHAGKKRR